MSDLLRWGGVRFLRRGRERVPPLANQSGRLPQSLRQHGTVALGLAAAAGIAGSVYCGAEALYYHRAAVTERAAAQTENAGLKAEIAQLRGELGGTRQALSAAQQRLGNATDDARHKIVASERAVGAE